MMDEFLEKLFSTLFAAGGVATAVIVAVVTYRLRKREKNDDNEFRRLEERKNKSEQMEARVQETADKVDRFADDAKKEFEKVNRRFEKVEGEVSEIKVNQEASTSFLRSSAYGKTRHIGLGFVRRAPMKVTHTEWKEFLDVYDSNIKLNGESDYLRDLKEYVRKNMILVADESFPAGTEDMKKS